MATTVDFKWLSDSKCPIPAAYSNYSEFHGQIPTHIVDALAVRPEGAVNLADCLQWISLYYTGKMFDYSALEINGEDILWSDDGKSIVHGLGDSIRKLVRSRDQILADTHRYQANLLKLVSTNHEYGAMEYTPINSWESEIFAGLDNPQMATEVIEQLQASDFKNVYMQWSRLLGRPFNIRHFTSQVNVTPSGAANESHSTEQTDSLGSDDEDSNVQY